MSSDEKSKEIGEILKFVASSPIFSSSIRLTILLALAGFKEINFTDLQKALEVNKSTLSINLKVLESEGVIQIKYKIDRNRPKQIIIITEKGKEITEKYLSMLEKYKNFLTNL